jgi:glycosyltransferase involved in cell wall biosynthesis
MFRNPAIAGKLERYQRIGHFDLWLVHNVFPAMSPVVYKKAFEWGVPVVHFLHNYRFGCTNGFLLNRGNPCEKCIHGNFWPALFKKSWRDSYVASGAMGAVLAYTRRMHVFERITRWIAISQAQKLKHVEMGIPAGKIDVIHHFLEPDAPPPPPAPDGYALFIGRISMEKGVSRLLDAWKILNRPDRRLVVLGEGPELPGLRKKAEALKLDNVRCEGFKHVSQQREIWAGAAFSIVPSIWLEPFGMVVLESWAKARPVVAHRIGALPELVEEGITGYLANPEDPGDLAAAIARAFDSPEETAAMGQEGLTRLTTHFTKKIWLEKMRQTLGAALGR